MRRIIFSLFVMLLASLMVAGCKKDKQETKTADDVDTDSAATSEDGNDEEDVEEEEEEVKKSKFPDAPDNDFGDREPVEYMVSIKKAQVVPADPAMECWDECNSQAKTAITAAVSKIGALGDTPSQSKFDSAAKLMEGGIGLAGGQTAFPDVFVHIRCGHNNSHKTKPVSDKMVAKFKYENKKMMLDARDECAISVWDSDGDSDQEIGRTVVPLVKMAKENNGKAIIYGQEVGFGLVYSLEIEVKTAAEADKDDTNKSDDPEVRTDSYKVIVVKAKVKDKKKDGKDWDADSSSGGTLASLAAQLGGKKADVFVEGWKNGYKSTEPFMKTGTQKENHEPEWNAEGRIKLNKGDHINFMVWDADAVNHDIIGECKTKKFSDQPEGELTLKNCGQVEYLVVKIVKI